MRIGSQARQMMTTQFKVDTEAQCNVLLAHIHIQVSKEPSKSQVTLTSFSGHEIKPVRKYTILSEYNGKYYEIEFQVVRMKKAKMMVALCIHVKFPACAKLKCITPK